ncbi:MAG TPA: hypothetical protein DCP08_00360 [Chloroflexi bacterium]|nr:hypothetical protein [Chloroflexota bacterium]
MSKREETRWERRERKYKKRRYGMRVSGRSVKAVLLRLIGKKAEEAEEAKTEAETDQSEKRE